MADVGQLLYGIGSIIGNIFNPISDLITGHANRKQNEEINQTNFENSQKAFEGYDTFDGVHHKGTSELQTEINQANIASQEKINQDNIDYARSLTQEQWERDDNAHQREVADLVAAGLSPLANTTGAQVTSGATSGPSVQSTQEVSPIRQAVEAEPYFYQAPQLDVNNLTQGMLGLGELNLGKTKESHEYENKKEELSLKQEEIDNEAQRIKLYSTELDIKDKEVNANIKAINEAIERESKLLNLKIEDQTFRHTTEEENNAFIRIHDRLAREVPKGMRYVPTFTTEETQKALERFIKAYEDGLKKVFGSNGKSASLEQDLKNATSMSVSGGVSLLANGSISTTRDISQKQKAEWEEILSTLQFPIQFSEDDKVYFDDKGALRTRKK